MITSPSFVLTHQCTVSYCWGHHLRTWFLIFLSSTLEISVIFPFWTSYFPSEPFHIRSEEYSHSSLINVMLIPPDDLILSDFLTTKSLSRDSHLIFETLQRFVSIWNFRCLQSITFTSVQWFSSFLSQTLI